MDNNKRPKLYSLLEDNSGGFSSSRLMALLWCGGVFLIWAFASLFLIISSHGTATPVVTFVPIPGEVITVMLGFAGLKVVQRFGEKEGSQSEVERMDGGETQKNNTP